MVADVTEIEIIAEEEAEAQRILTVAQRPGSGPQRGGGASKAALLKQFKEK